MNEDCLKVIEVENKLSGGVSLDKYEPDECPWCKAQCQYTDSDYYQDDWADAVTNYTQWATCNSCSKAWAVGYSRVYYQEVEDI